MKTIEIDDDVYHFIAAQTQRIGESASDILRRLLLDNVTPTAIPQDSIFDVVTAEALSEMPKRVDQFLFILSALYQRHAGVFEQVSSLRGKNRQYFAASKEALESSGSSTNPKPIPNSPYWVVTNNNTERKLVLLKQAMSLLGYDDMDCDKMAHLFAPETVATSDQ